MQHDRARQGVTTVEAARARMLAFPHYAAPRHVLFALLLAEGRDDEAGLVVRETLQLFPQNARAHVDLNAFLERRDAARATADPADTAANAPAGIGTPEPGDAAQPEAVGALRDDPASPAPLPESRLPESPLPEAAEPPELAVARLWSREAPVSVATPSPASAPPQADEGPASPDPGSAAGDVARPMQSAGSPGTSQRDRAAQPDQWADYTWVEDLKPTASASPRPRTVTAAESVAGAARAAAPAALQDSTVVGASAQGAEPAQPADRDAVSPHRTAAPTGAPPPVTAPDHDARTPAAVVQAALARDTPAPDVKAAVFALWHPEVTAAAPATRAAPCVVAPTALAVHAEPSATRAGRVRALSLHLPASLSIPPARARSGLAIAALVLVTAVFLRARMHSPEHAGLAARPAASLESVRTASPGPIAPKPSVATAAPVNTGGVSLARPSAGPAVMAPTRTAQLQPATAPHPQAPPAILPAPAAKAAAVATAAADFAPEIPAAAPPPPVLEHAILPPLPPAGATASLSAPPQHPTPVAAPHPVATAARLPPMTPDTHEPAARMAASPPVTAPPAAAPPAAAQLAATKPTAPLALPAGDAPPVVTIAYPGGDAAARARAVRLAETLRAAGTAVLGPVAAGAGGHLRVHGRDRDRDRAERVSYAFPQDQGSAAAIAARLDLSAGTVRLSASSAHAQPGDIQILLPRGGAVPP